MKLNEREQKQTTRKTKQMSDDYRRVKKWRIVAKITEKENQRAKYEIWVLDLKAISELLTFLPTHNGS